MATPTWTPVSPDEAIRFLQRKGFQFAFDAADVSAQEHARAFTVAKMTRLDLLADVRAAVERAIANGTTPEQFRKELAPVLQAKGWWGRAIVADPSTGKPREVQLGSKERLDMIIETNARTAYAAGRWEQIQRTKGALPYLEYVRSISERPRPEHLAWAGLVLPIDDPFWRTHYPTNGWRCKCSTRQLNDGQLQRSGRDVGNAPPFVVKRYENPRTGDVRYVPNGIDPGFERNVGIAHEGAARLFGEKVAAVPYARLGSIAWDDAKRDLVAPLSRGYASWLDEKAVARAVGERYPVGALSESLVTNLAARGAHIAPASAGVLVEDRAITKFASADLHRLPQLIDRPAAVFLDATLSSRFDGASLWYVAADDGDPRGRLVTRVEMQSVAKARAIGDKALVANVVRGSSRVPVAALEKLAKNGLELVGGGL